MSVFLAAGRTLNPPLTTQSSSTDTVCLVCGSEDMLKVEGMDVKLSEPITAGHLISAARSGNSKAEAVLNKGERTELFYRFWTQNHCGKWKWKSFILTVWCNNTNSDCLLSSCLVYSSLV